MDGERQPNWFKKSKDKHKLRCVYECNVDMDVDDLLYDDLNQLKRGDISKSDYDNLLNHPFLETVRKLLDDEKLTATAANEFMKNDVEPCNDDGTQRYRLCGMSQPWSASYKLDDQKGEDSELSRNCSVWRCVDLFHHEEDKYPGKVKGYINIMIKFNVLATFGPEMSEKIAKIPESDREQKFTEIKGDNNGLMVPLAGDLKLPEYKERWDLNIHVFRGPASMDLQKTKEAIVRHAKAFWSGFCSDGFRKAARELYTPDQTSRNFNRLYDHQLIQKRNGSVKWFDTTKGFGLIKPEDESPDVFVHQTSIYSKGFRSLAEGEKVEYDLSEEGGRTKAINVTGPNGAFVRGTPMPIEYSNNAGGGGGGRGRGHRRGDENAVGSGYERQERTDRGSRSGNGSQRRDNHRGEYSKA